MLQSQSVDVPLVSQMQSWPTTAGMAGRLLNLNNAIAKRWMTSDAGNRLRVEKRDGFAPFEFGIRDTAGDVSLKTLDGVSMLTNRGQQLLAIAAASIFACGRSNLDWFTPDYVCPTNSLTETGVVNRGTVDVTPDSAHIDGLTMYTWSSFVDPDTLSYFEIVDNDGTIVRQVSQFGEGA